MSDSRRQQYKAARLGLKYLILCSDCGMSSQRIDIMIEAVLMRLNKLSLMLDVFYNTMNCYIISPAYLLIHEKCK